MSADRLKRGDFLKVRLEGTSDEWIDAFVGIASSNNPSLVVLLFEGAVRATGGFCLSMLPLAIDYEKETVTSPFGDSYEIEVPD